ncbi:MAG: hypothetical protein HY816_00680 [Candidatus Wallbacteria bacterium]|nr:hypothetical protein [Candidatus Wallbacteria bacterium]
MRSLSSLASTVLFASALLASAADAGLRETRIAVDPADIGKRAFTSDPLVWVEPARYRELVETLRKRELAALAPPAPTTAPLDAAAVDAGYRGRLEPGGTGARMQATLRYHVLSAGPVLLPIAFPDVGISSATARSATGPVPVRLLAPEEPGGPVHAVVDQKGPLTLVVDFSAQVQLERGRGSFGFRLPDFAVKSLEMDLPPTVVGASITAGRALPASVTSTAKGVALRAALGAAPELRVGWFASGQAARETAEAAPEAPRARPATQLPARVSASTASLFVLGEETLSVRHELALVVTRGRASHVDLALPAAFEIQDIAGPLVLDWSAAGAATARTVRINLREPLRGESSILITGYQQMGSTDRLELEVPRVAGAARQQGVLGVSSFCTLEVAPADPAGAAAQQLEPSDLPGSLTAHSTTPILLAYRVPPGARPMVLSVKRYAAAGGLDALVENANAVTILAEKEPEAGTSGPRQATTFTKIILQLVNASRKVLAVKLDPAARISSCFVGTDSCSPALGSAKGEFLIPVPRSSVAGGKLAAFPVQLTYQLDLPAGFAESGTLRYGLPVVDVAVADYSWKVFTPESYRFLQFRGDLEDSGEESEFVLVAAAKWLFDRLLYDFAARLAALAMLLMASVWVLRVARRGYDGATACGLISRGSLAAVAGCAVVVLGLSAIAVPNFRAARERSNTRACFANQKTIAGAVEMYNLDQNTCRKELDAGFLAELVQQGYLQCIPSDPGQGPASGANYFTTPDGCGIACRVHGAIGEVGARVYGVALPPAESAQGQPAASRVRRDDRTNPINFRIPKTGQYTLLLRGFLPEGAAPGLEVLYHSAGRYQQLRALCWSVGAVLALVLVLPAARRRSAVADVASMGALLGILLALDDRAPALAADCFVAWTAAAAAGLALVLFGPGLERLLRRFEQGLESERAADISTRTLLTLLFAWAATAAPLPADELEVRLFAPAVPAAGAPGLLMPRSDLERLTRLAGQATAKAATTAPAESPVSRVERARYSITPGYPTATVEARYELWSRGAGWRTVALAGEGVDAVETPAVIAPTGALVLPAGNPGRFLFDLRGDATVVQRFSVPVARDGNRFKLAFPVPRAPINAVALASTQDGYREFLVAGGVESSGNSEFSFPAADELRLDWTNAAPAPAPAQEAPAFEVRPRIEASTWLAGQISDRVLRIDAAIALDVSRRPVARTAIELHPGMAVVDVRAPELADWSVEAVPGGQRLLVEWKSPVTGHVELTLMLEVCREASAAFELGLPAVAGASLEHVTLGLSSPGNFLLEASKLPPGTHLGDPSQPPAQLGRLAARPLSLLLAATRHGARPGDASAPLELKVNRYQQIRLLAAVADLASFSLHAARDGQLMGRARWLVKNNSEQFLRVRMPADARVLDCFVSGTAVTPAAARTDELLVPLEKSGVLNTQAAAFPVELTWLQTRPALADGGRLGLTLPHAQLPVSTLRLEVALPRELEATVVASSLQSDPVYREVAYAGENGEGEPAASGRRMFEQSTPPLKVPFPELLAVDHFSRDIVDPAGAAPFVELALHARQTSRAHRSLGFALALLLAFGLVLHGQSRASRRLRLIGLLIASGAAVGVTSFRPEAFALGLYFALGLFLGACFALVRWLAEWRRAGAVTGSAA